MNGKSLKAFIIGNISGIDKIICVCNDDFGKDRLIPDTDVFLNLTSRTTKTDRNLKEAVEFLSENGHTMEILPAEYVRFIRLMLTFPSFPCINERFF